MIHKRYKPNIGPILLKIHFLYMVLIQEMYCANKWLTTPFLQRYAIFFNTDK